MRPVFVLLLFVSIFSYRIALGQMENNSILDRRITIEAKNASIDSVLDLISSRGKVFFSYDPLAINAERKTNISITAKTIKETLDILFSGNFAYKVIAEQIVITIPETQEIKKKETNPEKANLKIITFKGRVIDRDGKDVLPYSSIYVLKKNIGTVSNNDGEFVLKIPESMRQDTISVSCLGYRPHRQPISEIIDSSYTISLDQTSALLKEIKVTVINPQDIINRVLDKIPLNYPRDVEILTSFYREVLKQDHEYIDVAEALMEIRKSSYDNLYAQDKIRFIKGRKGANVKPLQFVDFKIQGGPYYITKLDVIKTPDSFLNPEFRDFYKFSIEEIIKVNDRDTYVIQFKPKEKVDYPCYQGKLYVDMSSFALVQAEFELSRPSLKFANESLIRKKPNDYYVRPLSVNYKVSYRRADSKWHLSRAQAIINFRVRSKTGKENSIFHSESDLLITDFRPDDETHFKKEEMFSSKDIFTKVVTNYDDGFWGDYNIIKPSEDLRKSLLEYSEKNDSLFSVKIKRP